MLSRARRMLKIFHPQGIPWPGTVFYNVISKRPIFQYHYNLLAKDIASYCSEGRMLDVGTGPGWLLLKLYQYAPQLQLTGVDISAAMVSKAKANIAKNELSDRIKIKEGAAGNLPFPNASFDAVVSTGSIHHWKDPVACLEDVYRVLRSGGHALVYDLVSDTPADILREIAQEFGKLRMTIFWLHSFEEPFYKVNDFESLARSSSFKKGQTKFVGLLCCLILKKEKDLA